MWFGLTSHPFAILHSYSMSMFIIHFDPTVLLLFFQTKIQFQAEASDNRPLLVSFSLWLATDTWKSQHFCGFLLQCVFVLFRLVIKNKKFLSATKLSIWAEYKIVLLLCAKDFGHCFYQFQVIWQCSKNRHHNNKSHQTNIKQCKKKSGKPEEKSYTQMANFVTNNGSQSSIITTETGHNKCSMLQMLEQMTNLRTTFTNTIYIEWILYSLSNSNKWATERDRQRGEKG